MKTSLEKFVVITCGISTTVSDIIPTRHLFLAILHFIISLYSPPYTISFNKATPLGKKHKG
jgi:hypothetical protein